MIIMIIMILMMMIIDDGDDDDGDDDDDDDDDDHMINTDLKSHSNSPLVRVQPAGMFTPEAVTHSRDRTAHTSDKEENSPAIFAACAFS